MSHHTASQRLGQSRTRVTLTSVFYAVVAVVALTGATQAAQGWLRWPIYGAALAVGALELGGIVLAHHAAKRRHLGESALSARVASALVALAAVVANAAGHLGSPGQAAFFGVMSALGYVTWLFDSESRRRDALRAAGMLAEIPPVYGMAQWLREPRVTRAARVLAQRHAAERLTDATLPRMDALASLALARRDAAQRARHAAIAKVLHRKIRQTVDRDTADIAVAVYDLETVAERLASQADYAAITGLIGMDLTPERLTGAQPVITELPVITTDVPVMTGVDLPAEVATLPPAELPVITTDVPVITTAEPRKPRARKAAPRRTTDETRKLAEEALAAPDATRAEVAQKLAITPRRLRQVLSESSGEVPVIPGQLSLINGHELA